MGLDLFQSRNTYHEYCRYWNRDERDIYDNSELAQKRVPSGHFWAKEIASHVNEDQVVAGVFLFEKNTITIKSPDDLSSIKANDVIEFRGEIWRVDNIQKKQFKIQSNEFSIPSKVSHYWYLNLIK